MPAEPKEMPHYLFKGDIPQQSPQPTFIKKMF